MIHLVKKFLEINKYKDQKEEFENSYLSHPNYPSLFALTDTLNLLGVENIAARVPKEQFIELPDNFISMLDNDFILVNKKESYIEFESSEGKKNKLSLDDFLINWNQLVVAIEPNEISKTKLNNLYHKWYLYLLPCFILFTISVTINSYSFISGMLLTLSLIGNILGYFIIQEKLGIDNVFASKFCSITTNTSCNSVIKSSKGKINKWVDFSDLTILFFGTNLFSLLINPNTVFIITNLSLLSLPILAYSIWLQKIRLKKWCTLCLSISFIIFLQSLVNLFVVSSFQFNLKNTLFYIFNFIIIGLIWFIFKSFITENKKLIEDNHQLKRFKRNFSIFNSQLKPIIFPDNLKNLNGIIFKKSEETVKLSLFLSPSCGHCHTAFKDAYELYLSNPEKFSFEVLFNINPKNNDNPYKEIVNSILTINTYDSKSAIEAIIDWHIHHLNLEKWKEKWSVKDNEMNIYNEIQNQYNWCLENNFNYTPVKIINQKIYPQDYALSELKYFINEIMEEKLFSF